MSRIKLEVLPWVSDALDSHGAGHLVLEETIEEGATIGGLLRKLAAEHQTFGDTIFDTNTDKLSGDVMVVLNDRVVEALSGLDTTIADGDIIKLLPVIAGG